MVAAEEISEEELQQLRSKATELLLREDWAEYVRLYSHFISLFHRPRLSPSQKLLRFICLALSNRAEALHRLGDPHAALDDCDEVLRLDASHRKATLCKGKVLLDLDRYSAASACLRSCSTAGGCDEARRLLERCQRLEVQSRSGAVDMSEWVLGGFRGETPELAEYVGPVEIRSSENGGGGGRGLFATKAVEAGTVLMVTKAVVIGRGILPEDRGNGSRTDAGRLVIWKDVVDRLLDAAARSRRTLQLVYSLSTGRESTPLAIPDMGLFRPDSDKEKDPSVAFPADETDMILSILDVNSLTEDAVSAKVLGRSSSGSSDGVCAVGLWVLASFLNHSCCPNARRVHIGDRVVVHASRDVKAGEELTFAYFDVLQPLQRRKEAVKGWGFQCRCERCVFEEEAALDLQQELRELEGISRGGDPGEVVARLEDAVAKKGKKGFLRASFWEAYAAAYGSERCMRKWGRRIPAAAVAAESVAVTVGGDERVLKVVMNALRKGGVGGVVGEEVERAMRMGKGVYGKVVRKKQAMRALLETLKQRM